MEHLGADFSAESTSKSVQSFLTRPIFILVVGSVVAMWLIEIIDTIALDDWAQGGGIHPRRLDGIDGIAWAPFLHGGWRHLTSNTVPFIILGGLVALRGVRTWLSVTGIIIIVGGALTWLFARNGNHVGASGVIFGFLGYLVAAAWFDRTLKAIALAVLAVVLYGSMVFGLVPSGQVSWEGHLFGAAAGVLAAYALRPETTTNTEPQLA
ncbi:MAG: rhomboid family intramembrane serine protease [Acidimicrobiales bacterium]|nr:rhomboid family intramembrane serine protease [Acidimicrobiales bacterium]